MTGETNYTHHLAKLLQIEDVFLSLSVLHHCFMNSIEYGKQGNSSVSLLGYHGLRKALLLMYDYTPLRQI